MQRLLTIVCSFLICMFLLTACGEEPPVDGALTEVKDANGTVTGYERRYHNDNGDITRLDVYDANEEYLSYVLYDYDSDNRLLQETHYRADGIGDYYYAYVYDEDSNIIEKGWYSMTNGATRTLLDSDGNEVERYTYDDTDTLVKHEVKSGGQWEETSMDDLVEQTTAE